MLDGFDQEKKQSIGGLFIFKGQWAYKGTPSDLVAHIYNLGIPFKRSAAGFWMNIIGPRLFK